MPCKSPRVTVRPILCGAELGASGSAVVDWAAALATALQAPLELVHAIDMADDVPPDAPSAIAPALERLTARVRERVDHARAALADEQRRIGEKRVVCDAHLEQGRPWEAIVRRARERNAAFIVVGPHGSSASVSIGVGARVARLLGSTADRVVRHAPCPVLVATFDGPAPDTLDDTAWIVGVEPASPSWNAVGVALDLARVTRGSVTLARVLTPYDDHEDSWANEVRRRATPGAVISAPIVVRGAPADELAALGERTPRSVLVVGTHARTGLARFVLGSTTEQLLRIARVPVLCVQHTEADTPSG